MPGRHETLLDHWSDLVRVAAAGGDDVFERTYARCFIAGAMATLCIMSAAAKAGASGERFVETFLRLEAEIAAFMAEEAGDDGPPRVN